MPPKIRRMSGVDRFKLVTLNNQRTKSGDFTPFTKLKLKVNMEDIKPPKKNKE